MEGKTLPKDAIMTWRDRLGAVVHFVLFIYVVVLLLGTLIALRELGAPGAPVVLFWVTIGAGLVLALAILPAISKRLPRKVRAALRVGAILFIALPIATIDLAGDAWEKTPKGAAEAQKAEAESQQEAAADEKRNQMEAQAQEQEQAEQQAKAQQAKLEGCFTSWGHRLPKLEDSVKDSLGNPESFEQVKTEAIPTDPDGYNVEMTFRAQNRMGALWTFDIRGTVDPDSCNVTNVQPEPSES